MKALAAHGDLFASAAVAPQGASRWHLNQIYCECEAFTVKSQPHNEVGTGAVKRGRRMTVCVKSGNRHLRQVTVSVGFAIDSRFERSKAYRQESGFFKTFRQWFDIFLIP